MPTGKRVKRFTDNEVHAHTGILTVVIYWDMKVVGKYPTYASEMAFYEALMREENIHQVEGGMDSQTGCFNIYVSGIGVDPTVPLENQVEGVRKRIAVLAARHLVARDTEML